MIEGFILAGGQSSRMGTPKADIDLGGKTLLERAIATMSEFTPGNVTAIVEHSDKQAKNLHGVRFVNDIPFPGLASQPRAPIFGLYTALEISTAEWIVLLAVDLPFVSKELLDLLLSRCTTDVDAVIPIQPDGRRQPLCALYRRDRCRDAVGDVLAGDDLSFHALFAKVRVAEVQHDAYSQLYGSEHFFLNINTPDDLEMARRIA